MRCELCEMWGQSVRELCRHMWYDKSTLCATQATHAAGAGGATTRVHGGASSLKLASGVCRPAGVPHMAWHWQAGEHRAGANSVLMLVMLLRHEKLSSQQVLSLQHCRVEIAGALPAPPGCKRPGNDEGTTLGACILSPGQTCTTHPPCQTWSWPRPFSAWCDSRTHAARIRQEDRVECIQQCQTTPQHVGQPPRKAVEWPPLASAAVRLWKATSTPHMQTLPDCCNSQGTCSQGELAGKADKFRLGHLTTTSKPLKCSMCCPSLFTHARK